MSAHTYTQKRENGALEIQDGTDGCEKDGHGALRESGRAVEAFPRRSELGLRDSRELSNGVLQAFGVWAFPEEGFLPQLVL